MKCQCYEYIEDNGFTECEEEATTTLFISEDSKFCAQWLVHSCEKHRNAREEKN